MKSLCIFNIFIFFKAAPLHFITGGIPSGELDDKPTIMLASTIFKQIHSCVQVTKSQRTCVVSQVTGPFLMQKIAQHHNHSNSKNSILFGNNIFGKSNKIYI